MKKQTILIYDFIILYEILLEIKQNLNFDIIKVNNEKEFSNIDKNSLGNYLIITNNENNNLSLKNSIVLKEFPIKIISLIEKLNINLLKQKYNFQNDIKLNKYKLDLNSREISYNNTKLKLTEREIDVLVFLNESSKPKKIESLQREVWGYTSDLETHTVETHIYRLRKKIKDNFSDENFILNDKEGYYL